MGYKVGLNLYHKLSPHFFLEFNPAYVFQQFEIHQAISVDSSFFPYPIATVTFDSQSSFSWIELPVAISYSYALNEKVSLVGGLGMAVRNLLNSEIKAKTTLGNGFTASGTFDGRASEWSWFPSVNLGAIIRTSEISRLSFKMSYERNVSKLYRSPEPPPPGADYIAPDLDIFLNSIGLSVAYSVDIRSLK